MSAFLRGAYSKPAEKPTNGKQGHTGEENEAKATPRPSLDSPFYEDLDVLLFKFTELRDELDGALDFGSSRLSVMAARYPGGGARYARHRDALPEHNGAGGRRRLTAIYYMNPEWKPADGGCLRVYFPEAIGPDVPGAKALRGEDAVASADADLWICDVEPHLDRLVLFASEWLEHEVLPAYAERYTTTCWFY